MRALLLKQLGELASHSSLGPLERLRALWGVLVGRELAQRSRPERLDGIKLVVGVENASVAQELQLQSSKLIEQIQRYSDVFRIHHISQLATRVLPAASFPRRRAPDTVSVMPRPSRPVPARLQEALDDVRDEDLKEQLARLTRKRD